MPVLLGFTIILFFWVLGAVASALIGHFIPASVVGMLLLFAALCLRLVKPEQLRVVAGFLTKNMSLFFVPAAVGLMEQLNILKEGWVFIVVAAVVSTLAVMVAVALIQQKSETPTHRSGNVNPQSKQP